MGKGQKRKNAGVGVDFRRVKHKVGKKLPKAQNETDTSFKSRSITLPEQSALQDKAGAAVTHRNLTLKVRGACRKALCWRDEMARLIELQVGASAGAPLTLCPTAPCYNVLCCLLLHYCRTCWASAATTVRRCGGRRCGGWQSWWLPTPRSSHATPPSSWKPSQAGHTMWSDPPRC